MFGIKKNKEVVATIQIGDLAESPYIRIPLYWNILVDMAKNNTNHSEIINFVEEKLSSFDQVDVVRGYVTDYTISNPNHRISFLVTQPDFETKVVMLTSYDDRMWNFSTTGFKDQNIIHISANIPEYNFSESITIIT